jgi:single-stranded DNA-binding protein
MADTHVTLTGNLTDDPELRFTANGHAVATFRLAVAARVKDGEGWRDGDTSFFRVNVWRQLAEHVAESLSKGDRTVVIGRLRSRSWETPEGDSARWSRSRPTRSPPACGGPSPSPNAPPATATRPRPASSMTTRPSDRQVAGPGHPQAAPRVRRAAQAQAISCVARGQRSTPPGPATYTKRSASELLTHSW